jgi:hypothetical protein
MLVHVQLEYRYQIWSVTISDTLYVYVKVTWPVAVQSHISRPHVTYESWMTYVVHRPLGEHQVTVTFLQASCIPCLEPNYCCLNPHILFSICHVMRLIMKFPGASYCFLCLGPNVLFNALFSYTLEPCSAFNGTGPCKKVILVSLNTVWREEGRRNYCRSFSSI